MRYPAALEPESCATICRRGQCHRRESSSALKTSVTLGRWQILGAGTKSPNHFATHAAAQMLHGMLQIKFNGTDINPKAVCNFAVRKLFDVSGDEHLSSAVGQFGQGLFQVLELEAALDDHGRIRPFIGNVGDRCNFRCAEKTGVTLAPVLGDVDGGAKQIV